MSFFIQAGNPVYSGRLDRNDITLADAIESTFLLETESAILMWNHIPIAISYKYDISYMIDDVIKMLDKLQNMDRGEMEIHWLPDTFRCNRKMKWESGQLEILSHWDCTIGCLEEILNVKANISLRVYDFLCEWKSILHVIIRGLEHSGYKEDIINGMTELKKQYYGIKQYGTLYRNNIGIVEGMFCPVL